MRARARARARLAPNAQAPGGLGFPPVWRGGWNGRDTGEAAIRDWGGCGISAKKPLSQPVVQASSLKGEEAVFGFTSGKSSWLQPPATTAFQGSLNPSHRASEPPAL